MHQLKFCFIFASAFLYLSPCYLFAQIGGSNDPTTDGRKGARLIATGVPFLLITPDSRSGAMGDAGAAIFPDANAVHWNPAKLAFVANKTGASLSYSPWLQRLVPDINLAYLSAFRRLDDRNTIGTSLRYFSLGQIQLIDENLNDQGTYNPNEFAIDGSFSRKFGDNFSMGTAVRFIYSNLNSGQFSSGQDPRAGTALSADLSAYYTNDMELLNDDARLALGVNISNIGSKIGYVEAGSRSFLPTNLKVGSATTFYWSNSSEFTFAFDINKLLVPSPPEIGVDPTTGDTFIIKGRNPSTLSVPAAIFGSFSDAPGGLKEELQEISYSAGVEYSYNRQFALRAGYFYENPNKGNRQYFTVGAGLRYNVLDIDFAYLLANQEKSPLANTLRFSLVFNFEAKQNNP